MDILTLATYIAGQFKAKRSKKGPHMSHGSYPLVISGFFLSLTRPVKKYTKLIGDQVLLITYGVYYSVSQYFIFLFILAHATRFVPMVSGFFLSLYSSCEKYTKLIGDQVISITISRRIQFPTEYHFAIFFLFILASIV